MLHLHTASSLCIEVVQDGEELHGSGRCRRDTLLRSENEESVLFFTVPGIAVGKIRQSEFLRSLPNGRITQNVRGAACISWFY